MSLEEIDEHFDALIGTEINFASSDAWDDTALLNAFQEKSKGLLTTSESAIGLQRLVVKKSVL